jgi:ABC-type glutathione transport system ATPase component
MNSVPLLEVRGLVKHFPVRRDLLGRPASVVSAVDGVEFDLYEGETLGVVGESGCGKSTTAYAALRYLPRNAVITGGRILVGGQDITRINEEQVRDFRTHRASMVYQDPGAALNPTTKVGPQVAEAYTVLGQSRAEARESALAAMRRVHIADPERVYQRYPHQLSGGMQQRASLARVLSTSPKVLLMDEPFGALDEFTREAMNLELLRITEGTDMVVGFVTHNISEAVFLADRVVVMSPRPGRVSGVVDVDLPRPRSIESMQQQRFTDLVFEVRDTLGGQG